MPLTIILGVCAVIAIVIALKIAALIAKVAFLVIAVGLVIGAVFAYRHWDDTQSVRDHLGASGVIEVTAPTPAGA
jgi:hypothetical protein